MLFGCEVVEGGKATDSQTRSKGNRLGIMLVQKREIELVYSHCLVVEVSRFLEESVGQQSRRTLRFICF